MAGVALLAAEGEDCDPQEASDMNHDESPHLSARKAAAWLGLSARTLHRLREEGIGPDHYRFGHRILYRCDDLKRWAAERHVPGAPSGGEAAEDGKGEPAAAPPRAPVLSPATGGRP